MSAQTQIRHKFVDVIIAWAEGKKIQFNNENSGWTDYTDYCTKDYKSSPGFNNENTEWRIKPEKQTKWIAIFTAIAYICETQQEARECFYQGTKPSAVIQITYESGEGL